MFEREAEPWFDSESFIRQVDIPGLGSPVHCADNGLCLVTVGTGKVNAAISMAAILASDRLDLRNAYFLSAGIGGTAPGGGTLGFAGWADWVVDWDLGHHLLPDTAPDVPHGYLPGIETETTAFHLDDDLVSWAYESTRHLELQDSAEAEEARQNYPEQEGKVPYVTRCDTITGDNYWAGEELSARASYIMDLRTGRQGNYCTTQMEDTAIAAALERHGLLHRYLSLRTASNFDQPHKEQSVEELLGTYPGFVPAIANAYIVGSAVAHRLASGERPE